MEFISEDKKNVIVVYASIMGEPSDKYDRLMLKGLDINATYRDIDTGKTYSGSVLEHIGLAMRNNGDFISKMMIFEKF